MKTINSLSGGKTSSYMSLHYPADYNIFALIRIEDKNCSPKDKALINYVSDKIGMDFIATAEDDATLYVIRDLEQKIGEEIIWVSGISFDNLLKKRKALPNKMWRFCTSEMKLKPIYKWWKANINEVVKMRIGFRYDEKERSNKFTTHWGKKEWRIGSFPLIDDKIHHYKIKEWAEKSNLTFPADSNCVGCFWKQPPQLRKNWQDNYNKMQWFSDQEIRNTWKSEMSYNTIKKLSIQQDFNFGTGTGCQAGFCTD
jgi:hypothetical protein